MPVLLAQLPAPPDPRSPSIVVVDDVDDREPGMVTALVAAAASRRNPVRLVVGITQHRLTVPPLPGVQALVIGPAELWLTSTEAAALVRAHISDATDTEIAEAVRLGDGWAGAVAAAARAVVRARSWRPSTPARIRPGLDLDGLDALAAAVVDTLPDDERTVVLAVGRLDALTREDVAALTGSRTAVDLLARAADVGGLVTGPPGSSDGPWRLHPVLRRYLAQRTSTDGPDRTVVVQAHRRALRHFGTTGERVRAVGQAVAGGDPSTIADALVEHGPSLVAELREDVFDHAVAALPEDVAQDDPCLVAVRALRHRVAGDVVAGLRDAARLTELGDAGSVDGPARNRSPRHHADRILLALWEARYGLVAPGPALESAAAILSALDPTHGELCAARRSWLSFELGAVNLWLGDLSQATLWTERGTTIAELSTSDRLRSGALAHRAVVEVLGGAYAAAGASARESLSLAAAAHLLADAYTARAHVAAAWAAFVRLDHEAAWDHITSIEETRAGELDPTVLTLVQVVRGRLLTLQGAHELAVTTLSGGALRRADLPRQLRRLVAVARAELAAALRDVSTLHRESQGLHDLGYSQDATLFRSVAVMLTGDLPQARALLNGLLRNPTVHPATGVAAAACLVRLELVAGDPQAARSLVPDLVGRVATGTVDVLLVTAAGGDRAVVDLLRDEASLPHGNPYAATALDRLRRWQASTAPSLGAPAPGGVELSFLTCRETAVLRCLRDGMSYQDVGHALFITPNTVKTHVRSLYRKLGVSRSAQAVRRGRELGLLSPP